MNNGTKAIIGITAIAGLAAYYFYNLKQTAESLSTRIYKIGFDYLNTRNTLFTSIVFWVELLINNPNNTPLEATDINLSLLFNGNIAANTRKTVSTVIAANQSTIVKIPVSIPVLNIFRNVTDAIKLLSDKEPLIFNVIGSVTIPGGTIKVNETKTVSL